MCASIHVYYAHTPLSGTMRSPLMLLPTMTEILPHMYCACSSIEVPPGQQQTLIRCMVSDSRSLGTKMSWVVVSGSLFMSEGWGVGLLPLCPAHSPVYSGLRRWRSSSIFFLPRCSRLMAPRSEFAEGLSLLLSSTRRVDRDVLVNSVAGSRSSLDRLFVMAKSEVWFN